MSYFFALCIACSIIAFFKGERKLRLTIPIPGYSWVEQKETCIEIKKDDLITHLVNEGAKEYSVAVLNNRLHLVVALENNLIHFIDDTKITSAEIPGAVQFPEGLRVIPGENQIHLFYLNQISKRNARTLVHRIYDRQWSEPFVVASNVSADPKNFAVAIDSEYVINLVYCTELEGHLFYRVYDPVIRTWSGGVPFSKNICSEPKILATQQLHITWLEEMGGVVVLRYKGKIDTKWQPVRTLSGLNNNVYSPGWLLENDGSLSAVWMEQGKLFKILLWPQSGIPGSEAEGLAQIYRHEPCLVSASAGTNNFILIEKYQVEQEHTEEVEEMLAPRVESEKVIEKSVEESLDTATETPTERSTEPIVEPSIETPIETSTEESPEEEVVGESEQPTTQHTEVFAPTPNIKQREQELEKRLFEEALLSVGEVESLKRLVLEIKQTLEDLQITVLNERVRELEERLFSLRDDWRAWRQQQRTSDFESLKKRVSELESKQQKGIGNTIQDTTRGQYQELLVRISRLESKFNEFLADQTRAEQETPQKQSAFRKILRKL